MWGALHKKGRFRNVPTVGVGTFVNKFNFNLLTNVPTVGTFRKRPILCNAPQDCFYTIHNCICSSEFVILPTIIDDELMIDNTAAGGSTAVTPWLSNDRLTQLSAPFNLVLFLFLPPFFPFPLLCAHPFPSCGGRGLVKVGGRRRRTEAEPGLFYAVGRSAVALLRKFCSAASA